MDFQTCVFGDDSMVENQVNDPYGSAEWGGDSKVNTEVEVVLVLTMGGCCITC